MSEREKEKHFWKSEIFVGVRKMVMVKEENIWKRKIFICAEEREKEDHICREEKRRSKRGEIIGEGKLLTGQEEGGEEKCQGSVKNNFWNILNKLPPELTSPTLALATTSFSSSSMVSSTFLVVRDDGVKNHHHPQHQLQTALTRVPDELERR